MANPAKTAVKYLRESKEELEKVTWPSQKEVTRYSIIVIVLTILLAVYFGLLDWLLNEGLSALIRLVS